MLLQAYDYLHLHDAYGCRLQLGGSDQWGNITMGLELIRKVRGAEAFALTWPLLVRADGTKYGKSESGAIWLDAAQDPRPTRCTSSSSGRPTTRSADCCASSRSSPTRRSRRSTSRSRSGPEQRKAQRALARAVCTLVHGEAETERAERGVAGPVLRGRRQARRGACCSRCSRTRPPRAFARSASTRTGSVSSTCSCRAGLVASKTAARTALAQGGVYVNNRRRRRPRGPPRGGTIFSSTATSCCAGDGGTTTCCDSGEGGLGAPRPRRGGGPRRALAGARHARRMHAGYTGSQGQQVRQWASSRLGELQRQARGRRTSRPSSARCGPGS